MGCSAFYLPGKVFNPNVMTDLGLADSNSGKENILQFVKDVLVANSIISAEDVG